MSIFLEQVLEHHGVKGMKWGVTTRVKSSIGSKKREIAQVGSYLKRKNLTDSQLQSKVNRLRDENTLKRTKSRKELNTAYRERSKYSDAQIKKIAKRSNLEAEYKKQVGLANASQKKAAKAVINAAKNAPVGTYGVAEPYVRGGLNIVGKKL